MKPLNSLLRILAFFVFLFNSHLLFSQDFPEIGFKIHDRNNYSILRICIKNNSSDSILTTYINSRSIFKGFKCDTFDLVNFSKCSGVFVDDCCNYFKSFSFQKKIRFKIKYKLNKAPLFVVRVFLIKEEVGLKYIINSREDNPSSKKNKTFAPSFTLQGIKAFKE